MSQQQQILTASLGGTYRIERDLGGGGMSHVYVASDTALGRQVVVKQLSSELTGAVDGERFDREIRLAARLQHAHIVPLLTAGEAGGRPFFTMPFVDGETLAERIRRGPMSVRDATRILRDVASALAYAHDQGVVHRDIKPGNILLSGDTAVVTDFGVAKAISDAAVQRSGLTSMGVSLGTPMYMAPEQAAAEATVDHRADIYAFGVTAYEMVTGAPPFTGRNAAAILSAHLTQQPRPVWLARPDLPPVLSALIMRCIEKDPNDRPATAAEVIAIMDELPNPGAALRDASRRYLESKGARGLRRREYLIGGVVAVALLAAAGGWQLTRQRDARVTTAVPASIAVLPFTGARDSADEYFSDGMTDQLTATLGSVPGVRVASRTSAFAFKGQRGVNATEIGRQLRVDNILEGSVRRGGDRLRVLVQLTNARDGSAIWSQGFEGRAADIFRLQDSISRAVLDRLRVTLGGDARARPLTHAGTANLAAYDLYLRARHQFNKFEEVPLRESIRLYDEALALDPQFAQAWAGIAVSWLFLADDYVAPRIAYPAAKRAAEQALTFDSTLADAHAARGAALYQYEWKFDEGRRAVNRALAYDPHSFTAQLALHGLLIATGKPDSALVVLKAAEAADPLSVLNALLMGRFYGIVGRPRESIEEYRRVMQLAPPLTPMAMIPIGEAMATQGQVAAADSIFDEVRKMLGPDMEFLLASGQAAAGHRAEALRLVTKYEALAQKTYVRPELIAGVYVRLGDRERAFAWLEKARAARSPYLLALKVDRQWDPIRTDPRFADLVRRVGLP